MEIVQKASRIFKHLLATGEVSSGSDREMFLDLKDPEIRAAISVFEEEFDFHLVDAPNAFYLSPDSDNDLFGFQSRDFRRWFSTDGLNADGFMICHIIMVLLSCFYGGHNQNPKQREFMRVAALIVEMDKRYAAVLEDADASSVLEEPASLNFVRISELWSSKLVYEDGRSKKTKEATVQSALNLLVTHKLIRLTDEDKEIRPTRKLDDLMLHYYLSDARVAEVQAIFKGM